MGVTLAKLIFWSINLLLYMPLRNFGIDHFVLSNLFVVAQERVIVTDDIYSILSRIHINLAIQLWKALQLWTKQKLRHRNTIWNSADAIQEAVDAGCVDISGEFWWWWNSLVNRLSRNMWQCNMFYKIMSGPTNFNIIKRGWMAHMSTSKISHRWFR